MRTRIGRILGAAALGAGALLMIGASPGGAVLAAEEPGGCNGRTDPNVTLTAYANAPARYVLNVSTDASGKPSGSLVLQNGSDLLLVTDWSRVWQHIPGQPSHGEDEYPEGATTAHATGEGKLGNGQTVLARTDVRQTKEGIFFRVRYRALATQEPAAAPEGEDCEDESWTRVPAEGWSPLDLMLVRAGGSAGPDGGTTGDGATGGGESVDVSAGGAVGGTTDGASGGIAVAGAALGGSAPGAAGGVAVGGAAVGGTVSGASGGAIVGAVAGGSAGGTASPPEGDEGGHSGGETGGETGGHSGGQTGGQSGGEADGQTGGHESPSVIG